MMTASQLQPPATIKSNNQQLTCAWENTMEQTKEGEEKGGK